MRSNTGQPLAEVFSHLTDDTLYLRSTCGEHHTFAGLRIPCRIELVIRNPVEGFQREILRLSDLQINQSLPEWVDDFKIPDNVDVKEVEW